MLLSLNFLVVALVNFAVFFARSGRQTVIPLYADQEIGLSAGPIGLIFAMMAFINLLFIVPAGWAIDRFGVKVTIVPSAMVSFAAFALMAASPSTMMLVFSSLVLGVGSGLLGPAPAAYAAEIAPAERRGAAMGLFRSVGDLGFVVSPPLVGYLADQSGFGPAILINGVVLAASATVFGVFAGRARGAKAAVAPSPAAAP
jgi:MFS family permease